MATVDDLPFEVLVYMLSFLPGRDLSCVSRVCKRFFSATGVDSVWQRRCEEEYNISRTESEELSFKDLYCKLLHPYGWALGLWCKEPLDEDHYGGIVHVQFCHGFLVGYQLLPPVINEIKQSMQQRQLFAILPSPSYPSDGCITEKQSELQCRLNYHDTGDLVHKMHVCEVKQTGNDSICWKCLKPDVHRCENRIESRTALLQSFAQWAMKETSGNPAQYSHHLLMSRFQKTVWSVNNIEFHLKRFVVPPSQPGVVIQPGLFLGNYGIHGVEVMLLTYTDDGNTVEVKKITGDPNVPANKVSILADLSRPMILNEKQQATVDTLEDIDIAELPPGTPLNQLPTQPFCVPRDCIDRDGNPPNVCKARFHSKGHIAGHNYFDPSYIPGHWIVFDEDTFGHIWLEIRSLGMFSRVKQNLNKYIDCDIGNQGQQL